MVKKFLIIASFILFTYSLVSCVRGAGEMVLEWNYTVNPNSSSDQAYAVAVDSNNNIIVVGYDDNTTVNNDYQWRIMKFDPDGVSLWNYTINIGDRYDWARGVAVDSDNNFTVVGYDTPTAALLETEWIVMKFDENNNLLWNKTINISSAEIANGVAVDKSDNSIIVVGYDTNTTNADYQWRIMKFDPDGDSLWNYTVNPNITDNDQAYGVAVDSDNNIIVVGYDRNTTNADDQWRIMKFDPDGNSIWNYTANPSDATDQARAVAVDSDNNITVVGWDRTNNDYKWRIMKFDPDGNSIWNYTANPSLSTDQAFSVANDPQNNIIVVGNDRNTSSPGGGYQWRIMKLTPDGDSLWNYTYDPSSSTDQARAVAVDSAGNIIVVGYDDNTTVNNDYQWKIMRFTLCGNGVRDSVEKCDYSDTDPDGPCESYQYCNNVCQCSDLFDVWVEPNRMLFTIAQKTPVNLYIKNTGENIDTYSIEAKPSDPAVIDVDVLPSIDVNKGGTAVVRPWVTVLAATISGKITFNITSSSPEHPGKYRIATLSISEGLPISLFEFNILGLITLMILAGIVYFYVLKL